MIYVRPDESARLSYDLIKSGQFEKAIQQSWRPRGRRPQSCPTSARLIPNEKLPDFSVFAKYLSLGGSYSVMDDDGFTMTGFTLRAIQSVIAGRTPRLAGAIPQRAQRRRDR